MLHINWRFLGWWCVIVATCALCWAVVIGMVAEILIWWKG